MFTKEDLKSDPRFYIDDFNLDRMFANGGGLRYEIIFVRVGRILRQLDGRILTLYDTDVYPYLKGTIKGLKLYEKYCARCNTDRRTLENYSKLVEHLSKEEYDIKKGAIVIDEQNFILDGQHRACVLLYKHGPFYKIPVVRCYFRQTIGLRRRIHLLIICLLGNLQHIGDIIETIVKKWK